MPLTPTRTNVEPGEDARVRLVAGGEAWQPGDFIFPDRTDSSKFKLAESQGTPAAASDISMAIGYCTADGRYAAACNFGPVRPGVALEEGKFYYLSPERGLMMDCDELSDFDRVVYLGHALDTEFLFLNPKSAGAAAGEPACGNLANSANTSNELNTTTETTAPRGLWWSADETKLYVVDGNTEFVYQYDVTGGIVYGSYDSKSFDLSGQATVPIGVAVNPAGTRMIVVDADSNFFQYTLTDGDVDTTVYDGVTFDAGLSTINGMYMRPNGGNVYLVDADSSNYHESIHQLNFGANWDVSSLDNPGKWIFVGQYEGYPTGFCFCGTGETGLLIGTEKSKLIELSAASAWDITTLSASGRKKKAQGTIVQDVVMNRAGTLALTISHGATRKVYEYDLNGTPSIIECAEDAGNELDVSGEATGGRGFSFAKAGKKLYVIDPVSDTVSEYDCATAYKHKNATPTGRTLDFSTEGTDPHDLFVREDGTQLFILDQSLQKLIPYTFETAYKLDTAEYDGAMSEAFGAGLTGFWMSDDGVHMLLLSNSVDRVDPFVMEPAWDVTSLVERAGELDTSGELSAPMYLDVSADGTYIWVGDVTDVYEYLLTTALELDTGAHNGISVDLTGNDNQAQAIRVVQSINKMFLLGAQNDKLYDYDL